MKKIFLLLIVLVSINNANAQWQTSGPTGTDIYSLAVGTAGVFAGNENGGVYLSANNGSSWTAVDSPTISNTYVLSMAAASIGVVAGTTDGVLLSINNGTSWMPENTGLPANSRVQAIAASGSTNVFAGTEANGVFLYSIISGHWTEVNTGLADTDVYALAVSGSNIFAGTYGGGVFLSTNNGTSWTAINNGLTDLHVYAIAVSGANIFAGTENGSIFLSNNNGTSWTSVFSIEAEVTSFAISGVYIYAGTEGRGVFLSTDTGGTWNADNTGLGDMYIYSLAISDTTVFAGTFEGGVWQMPVTKPTAGTCTPPAAPTNITYPGTQKVCFGNSTTLTATGTGTLSWYSADTGGTYLQGGASFSTPDLDTTTTFYVQDSTCAASSRTSITVTVNPKPNAAIYLIDPGIFVTGGFASYQWFLNDTAINGATNQGYTALTNGNYQVAVVDTNGCSDTSAIYSETTVGISVVNLQNNIPLYPNPANNSFVIETGNTGGEQLQVFDITGKLLLSQAIQNTKTTVDVSGLAQGVYLVSLRSTEGAATQKLIIAK